ncbi:Copine-domain-containing protein [Gamsiella multidivaricata]|uniref:Copine-domain-containing protein n=1 Tax=Gamsiella multidivaricata TaxID=101098 RepID=UPI00221EA5AD|nr:Copine-domain-containing protein [Gamsiella multidivaricata]KAI7827632.1 Copine-domain-containing protein [Gamsiella multidivaricata]
MQSIYPHPPALPPTPPKVVLNIKCRNLANRDIMSFSDPQVFLFLFDDRTDTWCSRPHAMTERIKDNLNPVFVNGLEVEYRFEMIQRLKFVVYDIDDKHSGNWSDQDFLGEVTTDMGSIIGSRGSQAVLQLQHPKRKTTALGQIIVYAEELKSSKRTINFGIRALDLTKKGLFKSRPTAFFTIYRDDGNTGFLPVYRSKAIQSEDDPIWKEFSIKESFLCNGDPHRKLKIEIKNSKGNGVETVIGTTAVFTLNELSQRPFPHSMAIPPMTGTSALIIQKFTVTEPPSFTDFIAGGGTIGLCVAVDFTASNGPYNKPGSLHFRSPNGENGYTQAIRSVGNILQCYDTDKKFPVYGFGGSINGQVSHAFPLNGNPTCPEVYGVEGILSAYWNAQSFVELHGPTNFAPVIMEATNIAMQSEPYGYTILLILTDGAISDM